MIPVVEVSNADRIAARAMASAWRPLPPVDHLDFARNHIVFSEAESRDFQGPYNERAFPFFSEILRALSPSDPCRVVTLKKSAQLGGTIAAVIFTLSLMARAKGLLLYVHPTDDNARRWSKLKLRPLMESTAIVRDLYPKSSRDQSDSVLYKERADGAFKLQISGANSPASLSMLTAEYQVQDDLSKWVVNDAGDPEGQADSRSQAVEFAKIFKISTPLVNPGCKISKNYAEGSQEEFEVPCPHCQVHQVLRWENLKAQIEAGFVDDAHFTCVACGCEIHDHHRAAITVRGRWVARNPKVVRHHRSFHLWSAYSPLQTLARIAHAWIKARGSQDSERTFLNDVAGLEFETSGEAPPWEEIRTRAEEIGHRRATIPLGGLVLTCGIDVQGNRVEWQVLAHTRNRGAFVVDCGVIDGHISDEATREALDRLVKSTWRNAVGRDIGLDRIAIDGNAYTDDVLSWAKRHPAAVVMMVRGMPGDSCPKLAAVKKERNRAGKLRRYGGRFYNVGTSPFKLKIYHHLKKSNPEEVGYIGFPRGLPDDYYQQLTSERRREIRRRNGAISYEWKLEEGLRNEALDTFVYALAAAFRFLGDDPSETLWDRFELERETPPPERQGDLEDLFAAAPAMPSRPALPAAPAAPAAPSASRPGARVLRRSRSSLL